MPDASADDYDGFQTQFTHIMETILQTAVREATKLYDGTLQRLKAELVQLRQEKVNTKTGDTSSQSKRFSEAGSQRTGNDSKHRDIGVQCEKPTLVDRGCSPLQFIGQRLNVGDITSDKLTDLCASEDGNRQLALLLIKKEPQETECNSYAPGYFLLKQEGAEPILVRREPNKDTVERVVIPSALQTIARPNNNHRGKSPPPPVIPSSCSRRVDSSGQKPNQTIQPSRGTSERTLETTEGLSSQNKRQNASAPAQTSTSSVLPNSTQTPASNVNSSVPMIELSGTPSIPQTKPTASLVHRRPNPNPNPQTSNQTVVPQKERSNICHNTYLTPVPPSQVLVTEPYSSKQRAQALVSHTEKTLSTIASLNQATEPLTQCSSQLTQPPFFPPQSIKTPAQEMTPQVHTVMPSRLVPVAAAPNTLPPVQDRIPSSSLVPPQSHVFASPQVMPAHSVNSSPSFQFPLVLPHNPVQATPPSYLPTHVPFSSPHIPVNPIQGSVSLNPPQPPLTQSQYPPQSDQFSSSPDQFFPPPDNTPGLLESLDTLHLHSPIMITPQDAPEQAPMHHFQPSGQFAPLLTLKEQQAPASANVVLGRVPIPSVDTSASPVDNFETNVLFSPCCTERNDKDLLEDDDTPTLQSRLRKQRKICSKSRQIDPAGEDGTLMVKDKRVDQVQNDLISETPNSGSNNGNQLLPKPPGKTLQRNTECPQCGRVLSNASALENHMRLHTGERPYTCSQCGKAFPSVRGLNRHVKVHAEEKRYQCEECGKSFVYHFTLTKHQLIHSGERPFPCKVCGKRFLAKADRATHMRMHTGEKPFSCTLCGKKFKHRVALNMHMQGHRGEKRYICPHCEKGFVDLGNFKRHKLIHTGERPFECKKCGKRFTQSAHLKKHINTQHVT
ncbi:uncharacterized protein LOC107730532 isoform X1 [Sinocyclocheilus rhinocerous]|uniref:uncharacterized protein LOC107730532 isoform X1 n=1 Tax=Sinocyclocheilus rhinocerous TaxID=307959 RepID=UPI0007B80683|nr:PREDICTED: uncharacterized protein LOC107730532 isoform X1 [Sinocyclocheilus rhinocerous]